MKMLNKFNFQDLFIFDLANNHQGDVDHAMKIIDEVANLVKKYKLNGAIKFQFRELSTFIHKDSRESKENKHIDRFLSTELNPNDFKKLADYAKVKSLKTICTPFDEASVDLIKKLEFDAIKIASCSSKDWPLIEKIASANLPIVFSTGGLFIEDIDNLVSFLDHKASNFAIMHCVSIYPTPSKDCNLVQISVLKQRYPNNVIGWSTHEDPNSLEPVQVAYSLGARMFERHVGFETNKYKLNSYSSNPSQLNKWIKSYKNVITLYGREERFSNEIEISSINSLSRGVYSKKNLKKGELINHNDVYFAMPIKEGQLTSGEFKPGIICNESINKDAPLNNLKIVKPIETKFQSIKSAIHEIRAMLNKAKIALSSEFEIEISHHYGIENYKEFGALIITCINREYCKKLLVVLPNQKHPNHYHKLKEETFQVLSGTLDLNIDGHEKKLYPGDCCLVQPGVFHSFTSKDGCIVEEISTTHFKDDSFYQDDSINRLESHERKTKVDHWGRYQMTEDYEKQKYRH